MMAKKKAILVGILVFLVASVAMAGDNDKFTPSIHYTSEEEVLIATKSYTYLYSYAATLDDSIVYLVALDNPETLQIGDAIAVFSEGELSEFWQLIGGELQKVFSSKSQTQQLYI